LQAEGRGDIKMNRYGEVAHMLPVFMPSIHTEEWVAPVSDRKFWEGGMENDVL
jgi:hypothetical protein